ncbi:unnamed protein product [Linum trigynum]|uniref:Uncharacterized protein n=1 Tax=Linum trigynum TaxID=586398 RepID=A0AAV2EZF0_9ROSI
MASPQPTSLQSGGEGGKIRRKRRRGGQRQISRNDETYLRQPNSSINGVLRGTCSLRRKNQGRWVRWRSRESGTNRSQR